jgi:uncharacterized protein (TIGR03086 family)
MTSDEQATQVELLTRAFAATSGTLERVTREQFALPTPCDDWQVRDLIEHIVGAAHFFTDVAELGYSPEEQEWPTESDGDFAAAFGRYARRAVVAFSAPGAMERAVALPSGPTTGARAIEVATGEMCVHGWDLAKAVGHVPAADEGVAEGLLASEWIALCAQVRDSDSPPFAPEVRVSREMAASDRLAGFLGRDPGWSGGQ